MDRYRLKGTAGPVVNQSFPITPGLRIGHGPDCDVDIGPDAPAMLALEVDDQGRVRIVEGAEDALVNGAPATAASLNTGDEIRVGHCAFLLQAPGLRPDRVLTEAAPRTRRPAWPWWLAGLALAAAALAWQAGWLTF